MYNKRAYWRHKIPFLTENIPRIEEKFCAMGKVVPRLPYLPFRYATPEQVFDVLMLILDTFRDFNRHSIMTS